MVDREREGVDRLDGALTERVTAEDLSAARLDEHLGAPDVPDSRGRSNCKPAFCGVVMTMVYDQGQKGGAVAHVVSKSKFKPRALRYFREVAESGKEVIVTDRGKPVVKIVPYVPDHREILKELRGSVQKYIDPTEPVARGDWESLR